MPQLIKSRAIVEDRWTLLREAASIFDVPPGVPAIVPLALWKAERDALLARGDIGVWLQPDDEPQQVAGDVTVLPLIAVEFPKFTDGRGYSIAAVLRREYGYTGELRAVGDVLRDQLYAMEQCGFDAYALRADRSLEDALKSFSDFSDGYQATVRQPIPLFRRRARGIVHDHSRTANDPS
jgi:uncharacterized protein (DUF934 family)